MRGPRLDGSGILTACSFCITCTENWRIKAVLSFPTSSDLVTVHRDYLQKSLKQPHGSIPLTVHTHPSRSTCIAPTRAPTQPTAPTPCLLIHTATTQRRDSKTSHQNITSKHPTALSTNPPVSTAQGRHLTSANKPIPATQSPWLRDRWGTWERQCSQGGGEGKNGERG